MLFYSLHGLTVASVHPLAAVPAAADMLCRTDVVLQPWQVDEPLLKRLADEMSGQPLLIQREFPATDDEPTCQMQTVVTDKGWRTLFFGEVLFDFNRHTGELIRVVGRAEDAGLGDALQCGSYWAVLTALQGRFPLHASAVDLPDGLGTWLILAPSGHGKTSTAASLAMAGARLRSDDVVTLQRKGSDWRCDAGSLALRLRQPPDASWLPDHLSLQAEPSADGRSLLTACGHVSTSAIVRGICFPVLDEACATVEVRPISRLDAFQRIGSDPRVAGLQSPSYLIGRVEHISQLCRDLPLLQLTLPFRARHLLAQGRQILDALKAGTTVHAS